MAALSRHSVSKASRLSLLLPATSTRFATWKGTYLGPGPCEMDLDDGATKPDGVPDTWTTTDIWTDYGRFDEDTFPVALVCCAFHEIQRVLEHSISWSFTLHFDSVILGQNELKML